MGGLANLLEGGCEISSTMRDGDGVRIQGEGIDLGEEKIVEDGVGEGEGLG